MAYIGRKAFDGKSSRQVVVQALKELDGDFHEDTKELNDLMSDLGFFSDDETFAWGSHADYYDYELSCYDLT